VDLGPGAVRPVAVFSTVEHTDDVVAEAIGCRCCPAACIFTSSMNTAYRLGNQIANGMIPISHLDLALSKTRFGEVKDSGEGWEGGSGAIESCPLSLVCDRCRDLSRTV